MADMDAIDIGLFIDEIRKKPSLWDPTSELYKSRELKKDNWSEICARFFPGFWENDENERAQLGKLVQMKWRHIRDAYVRHNRLAKRKGSKHFRPYIYAKHLEFLYNVIDCQQADSSLISEHNTEDSTEDRTNNETPDNKQSMVDDNTAETKTPEYVDCQTSPSSASFQFRRFRRKKRRCDDRSDVNVQQNKTEKVQHQQGQTFDDMAFFTSLLPTLQTLRPEQKLLFRIDVMKLLAGYNEQPQQNCPTQSHNYTAYQKKEPEVSACKVSTRMGTSYCSNESEDMSAVSDEDSILTLYSE